MKPFHCLLEQVIDRGSAGDVVRMEGVTNLQGKVSSTKWKLTWLAESLDLVPVTLVDFDYLISKKKLEEDDEIEDLVTVCSVRPLSALLQASLLL